MNLAQLKYFSALAKNQNLTATANQLFVSPSALSIAISSLEKEIGLKLFDRSGKQLRLNDAGYELANYVDNALSELQKGLDCMRYRVEMESISLTIAITSPAFFLPLFDSFHLQNEDLSLKTKLIDLEESVLHAQSFPYDFFIGVLSDIDKECFEYEVLFEEPLVAVVSTTHRFAKKYLLTPDDLREETIISPGDSFPSGHKVVLELCRQCHIPSNQILTLDMFFRSKSVSEGKGIGITTQHGYYLNFLDSRATVCIPISGVRITRKQIIAWRPHKLTATQMRFLEHVRWYYKSGQPVKWLK